MRPYVTAVVKSLRGDGVRPPRLVFVFHRLVSFCFTRILAKEGWDGWGVVGEGRGGGQQRRQAPSDSLSRGAVLHDLS